MKGVKMCFLTYDLTEISESNRNTELEITKAESIINEEFEDPTHGGTLQ
jgi:hypothetical protein